MSKIQLSKSTFTLVPEGTHVFLITDVTYKEEYGKLSITMETSEGYTHEERFQLIKSNGEFNDSALKAFSYFARIALNDFECAEIDHDDLVGHYIRCEVTHTEPQPNKNNPEKTVQFVRLGEKTPADGFDNPKQVAKSTKPISNAPKPVAKPTQPIAETVEITDDLNIDDILG